MRIHVLFLIMVLALTASCTSSKKVTYFQGIDSLNAQRILHEYQVRIAPNDNLHITVSSINPEAAVMFNTVNTAMNVNVESLGMMGYLVDSDGNINFPVLGSVHLGGMTKTEAVEYLKKRISEYIVNPTVNIRVLNYKITVLGEVTRPGTFTIRDERVTVPEALGLAGDMTIYGKRSNVLLCREVDGKQYFHRIDMTSPDTFASDFYYLRQNDILYVQPNKARAGSSGYNQNLGLGVSFLSLLVTVVALIVR